MKKEKKRLFEKMQWVLQALLAYVGTYGLCVLGRTMGMERVPYSVFVFLVFLAIWIFLSRTKANLREICSAKERKRRIIFSYVVSYLFALSMLWGYQLQNNGMTDLGFRGKGTTLFQAACLAVVFVPLANLFWEQVGKLQQVSPDSHVRFRPIAVFGVCAGGIFLCLIPVWLAYYPIIMSYDFHRQINEAYKGFAYFFPYQPIAHTWVIWVFLQLGTAVGSWETGFACMALFQMLLYALVTGYVCNLLYRMLKKILPVIVTALFFGVFPFHSVLVICTTKDVLFTILFLLFFALFLERSLFCKDKYDKQKGVLWKKKNVIDILWVLEGCLMVQFRNNAFYAVAIFMVLFIFLSSRKEKLRMVILCILLVVGGRLTGVLIKEAIGTKLTFAKVEMFSVPIQQMVRVGCNHGDYLDESTAARLDEYIPKEIWSEYYPPLADGAKNRSRVERFTGEYGRLFSFWLELGLQYPNDYMDAFLELTRGYWFWDDVSWTESMGYGVEGRMGAVFTYNSSEVEGVGPVVHESKFPWLESQLEKIVSGNSFYDFPIFSIFFTCAFYTWSMFLLTMAFLYRKQMAQFKMVLLPWLYFGTVLLGPVALYRYIFPISVLLPLLTAMLFIDQRTRNEEEESLFS